MENMNGQTALNGQAHLKSSYSHEERGMKNGSSGSNSSEYRFSSSPFSLPSFLINWIPAKPSPYRITVRRVRSAIKEGGKVSLAKFNLLSSRRSWRIAIKNRKFQSASGQSLIAQLIAMQISIMSRKTRHSRRFCHSITLLFIRASTNNPRRSCSLSSPREFFLLRISKFKLHETRKPKELEERKIFSSHFAVLMTFISLKLFLRVFLEARAAFGAQTRPLDMRCMKLKAKWKIV